MNFSFTPKCLLPCDECNFVLQYTRSEIAVDGDFFLHLQDKIR